MNSNFRDYISIGINHHLLCKFIATSAKAHAKTLFPLLEDERFDVMDLWIVGEEPYRTQEINAIRACGKKIVYNVGDREGNPILYPTSRDRAVRSYTIDTFKAEISRGIEAGAKKVVTSTGPKYSDDDQESYEAVADFYCELCDFVPNDVDILVEPTDTNFDKCFFIGSSKDAKGLVEAVRKRGYNNFASMIDMCHLPQLGETAEQAICDLGSYMQHIHLGTCVIEDVSSQYYGDKHPAWDIEGTVWGQKELVNLIYLCLQTGYFGKQTRGTASFEMVAYDGIPYLESVNRFYEFTQKAWDIVPGNLK